MEEVYVKANELAAAIGACEGYKKLLAAGEKLAGKNRHARTYAIFSSCRLSLRTRSPWAISRLRKRLKT